MVASRTTVLVEIDNARFDALPDLSRELVNAQPGAVLAEWFVTITDKCEEIVEFIRAFGVAGYDTEAQAGKLGFLRMARRWIERRLIELKVEVPYGPQDPRTREITRLMLRIKRLRQHVRDLGGEPDDSLSPHFKDQRA